MNTVQRAKAFLKQEFPSIWLQWHFARRPKSAERELQYLEKIVPRGALTVDVGANLGLYTRRLARLSKQVYAFEPSHDMARFLRRTSASNVTVHEIALSDENGEGELFIPQDESGSVHGLASLEPQIDASGRLLASLNVRTARLDTIVDIDVAFVKIDVEGHELNVLNGATSLIDRCQPVFLVEAEDRHRPEATRLVFDFFRERAYRGFFLKGRQIVPVDQFNTDQLQNVTALMPNGGRLDGQSYVNNFFFFPHHLDGEFILAS